LMRPAGHALDKPGTLLCRLSPKVCAPFRSLSSDKRGWPVQPRQATRSSDRLLEDLLDLGFAKFDVLLGDRIVFLLDQFICHCPRILARHVIKAGVRAGYELDFDRRVLGHETLGDAALGENLVSKPRLSRKYPYGSFAQRAGPSHRISRTKRLCSIR